ncbi:hypothetical protein [Methylomonas sp. CM2]|uniref:hypothetical protein n=1 Tax=Methylomonas sp. CM2 TaxID=3417647 RepID=UPI003CEEB137
MNNISIFLPKDTAFYRRLYSHLSKAFLQAGFSVSGLCRVLDNQEMSDWVKSYRPKFIFEMNRVKNEIPVLHDLKIPHITWIVDFQGRNEHSILGSDITYFFDSGWDDNYSTCGFQDWLPPGTCVDTYRPIDEYLPTIEFSFIGHIPLPWSQAELNRPIIGEGAVDTGMLFGELLEIFNRRMNEISYFGQTHASLLDIIDNIVFQRSGLHVELTLDMRYDFLERVKRVKNRTQIIAFPLSKTRSVAIYGSEHWRAWPEYQGYYRYYIDDPTELNRVHQISRFNLHDGVGFHFRAIDCMASGGLLCWYNENSGDKYNRLGLDPHKRRGLHSFFDNSRHYVEFLWHQFDEAYAHALALDYRHGKQRLETIDLIRQNHTWRHRVEKIVRDFNAL